MQHSDTPLSHCVLTHTTCRVVVMVITDLVTCGQGQLDMRHVAPCVHAGTRRDESVPEP